MSAFRNTLKLCTCTDKTLEFWHIITDLVNLNIFTVNLEW